MIKEKTKVSNATPFETYTNENGNLKRYLGMALKNTREIMKMLLPKISNEVKNMINFHLEKTKAGVAFLDVSTGEFLVAQGSVDYIEKLIQGFKPSEVLYQRNRDKEFQELFGKDFYTYRLDDWAFTYDFGKETILKHFGLKSLKGFGIEDMDLAIIASGAILQYLSSTEHKKNIKFTCYTRHT